MITFRKKREQQEVIRRAEVEGRKAWMLLVLNETRSEQYLKRRQYLLNSAEVAYVVGCDTAELEFHKAGQHE